MERQRQQQQQRQRQQQKKSKRKGHRHRQGPTLILVQRQRQTQTWLAATSIHTTCGAWLGSVASGGRAARHLPPPPQTSACADGVELMHGFE